jgi:hypothetical protein
LTAWSFYIIIKLDYSKKEAFLMIGSVSYASYTMPIAGARAINSPASAVARISRITPLGPKDTINVGKTQPSECQTCKDRKYTDVSNESDVSFQTPTSISPQASFAAVSTHEQQHVSNAVAEGNKPGNKLISASVSYQMGVCPECGTPYVAGGTTRTMIKYNENNPYESARKSLEGSFLRGMNFDSVA